MCMPVQASLDVCDSCALADEHDRSISMAGQHQQWWAGLLLLGSKRLETKRPGCIRSRLEIRKRPGCIMSNQMMGGAAAR